MHYKLTPVNKILVIEREEEKKQEEDRGFVLPTIKVADRHITVTLKTAGEGSNFSRYEGSKLVVVSSMIEEITVAGNKFHILPENGVVAVAAESEFF